MARGRPGGRGGALFPEGMSLLCQGAPLFLALLHHVVFFLAHFLRPGLLLTLVQHQGQHLVVLLIKLGIASHISAHALFADVETLYHLPVQQPVAQELVFGKVLSAQLLYLLADRLGQVAAFPLQGVQPAGPVEEQIGDLGLLFLSAVQRHCQPFFPGLSVQLLYIGNDVILHVDFAVGIRFSDLCDVFGQFHTKIPPIPFVFIITSACEVF